MKKININGRERQNVPPPLHQTDSEKLDQHTQHLSSRTVTKEVEKSIYTYKQSITMRHKWEHNCLLL
jgi:hypothetical protein